MYVVTLSVFHNLAIWLLYVNKPEPEQQRLDTPEQRISGLTLNNVIIDRAINEWQNDCGGSVNAERQHSNTCCNF